MNKCFLFFYSILFTSFSLKINAQEKYTYRLVFSFSFFDKIQANSATTHLFSTFDKYLFEYTLEEKDEAIVNTELGTIDRKLRFDTLGVYVIDLSKKQYIQIDSFSKDYKLINSADNKHSSFALKLNSSFNPFISKNDQEFVFVDTTIENQSLKYTIDTIKSVSGSDSIVSKSYFTKCENLLTPWGIHQSTKRFQDLTFTGFTVTYIEQKTSITCNIQEIKILGKKEEEISRAICEKLKNYWNN
jgi:hypothetical protein